MFDSAVIYSIVDTATGAVRYVGCTSRPRSRMEKHRTRFRRLGIEPEMKILATVVDDGSGAAVAMEAWWIEHYVLAGADLLNKDRELSPNSCQKMMALQARGIRAWRVLRSLKDAGHKVNLSTFARILAGRMPCPAELREPIHALTGLTV